LVQYRRPTARRNIAGLARPATSLALLILALAAACAQFAPPPAGLEGTSWQLVRFKGGDGELLEPDERAKYTLAFGPEGVMTGRLDCNRARGSWKSASAGQLEFGPMAITRAQCPPGSLHDQLVKQLPFVRSYLIRDQHLFLSLMADGGIYEFEPLP
jgi:para-nitrobenzyl esterase